MGKVDNSVNKTAEVDDFMAKLDHPFKAEVEMLRACIKSAHPKITEQVKWKAPSFAYNGQYLVTFNLWATEHVHLVFHNPHVVDVHSDLLEGKQNGRRMAYLRSMAEAKKQRTELKRVIKELIRMIDNG